jgi:8-oxo-dGTP diphosphatase
MQHRIRAAGLLVEDNRVLMLNVEDGTGQYWILPGGGLEKGDNSTKEALRREFLE